MARSTGPQHDWKKAGCILKVVLQSSYARGTRVDEAHTAKSYQANFDLLIIVEGKRLVDRVRPPDTSREWG